MIGATLTKAKRPPRGKPTPSRRPNWLALPQTNQTTGGPMKQSWLHMKQTHREPNSGMLGCCAPTKLMRGV